MIRRTVRKLVSGLVAGSASALLLSGVAAANLFLPLESTVGFKLGALAPIEVSGTYRNNGWATLTNDGTLHDLSDTAGIWQTVGRSAGTSLFTGVALLDDLVLTIVNDPGSFTASYSAANPVGGGLTGSNASPYSGTLCPAAMSGGCLGGTEGFTGQVVVWVGGTALPFDAAIFGVGGLDTLPVPPFGNLTATGGPFVTGKVRITAITTNVISLPSRSPAVTGVGMTLSPTANEPQRTFTVSGGFLSTNPGQPLKVVHTVTIAGTNNLASTNAAGTVTLVSPIRVNASIFGVGIIPGLMRKRFVFVPEPGTLLALASGAALLAVLGHRKLRP